MTPELEGEATLPSKLRSKRAIAVHDYLSSGTANYFQLIKSIPTEQFDILHVQIGVEVSQRRTIDIWPTERIAISFNALKDTIPTFMPLRSDFPIDLVHVMVDSETSLLSLCLWDRPFEELKSRLTPFRLLARLKEWLEQASDGILHYPDQPLEPVFIGCSHQIILPIEAGRSDERYLAFSSPDLPNHFTLSFESINKLRLSDFRDCDNYVLAAFTTPVIDHRAVRFMPRNLEQLQNQLRDIGFDLREELTQWVMRTERRSDLLNAIPVILLTFPKRRTSGGDIETYEECAFSANSTFGELGEALGAFADTSNLEGIDSIGFLLSKPHEPSSLGEFLLVPMSVTRELSSSSLPTLSGYSQHQQISALFRNGPKWVTLA